MNDKVGTYVVEQHYQFHMLVTNATGHSTYWKANSFSSSQETPQHFMEPKGTSSSSQEPATCI